MKNGSNGHVENRGQGLAGFDLNAMTAVEPAQSQPEHAAKDAPVRLTILAVLCQMGERCIANETRVLDLLSMEGPIGAQVMLLVLREADRQLDPRKMVERIKAEFPRQDPKELYGVYVARRNLRPDISAREFHRLFKQVTPDPHEVRIPVRFRATHMDRNLNQPIMIAPGTDGGFVLLWRCGMTGTAKILAERFVPLVPAESMAPSA